MTTAIPLPPAEFNPTVTAMPLSGGRHVVTVDCFSAEVGRVTFDPATRPDRDWNNVVMRWARMVVARERRKWLEG